MGSAAFSGPWIGTKWEDLPEAVKMELVVLYLDAHCRDTKFRDSICLLHGNCKDSASTPHDSCRDNGSF